MALVKFLNDIFSFQTGTHEIISNCPITLNITDKTMPFIECITNEFEKLHELRAQTRIVPKIIFKIIVLLNKEELASAVNHNC